MSICEEVQFIVDCRPPNPDQEVMHADSMKVHLRLQALLSAESIQWRHVDGAEARQTYAVPVDQWGNTNAVLRLHHYSDFVTVTNRK